MIFSFKKSNSFFSQGEVDKVVHKLKQLYRHYAAIYGEGTFNLKAFEKRYIDALKGKVDINAFLHAEISVFEELKCRVIKPEKKKEGKYEPSYSEIADRIIEENVAKIKKYKYIDIHPDAEVEVKYLLGAVTDFYYSTWTNASEIIKGIRNPEINNQLERLEHDFAYYIIPVKGAYSRAVDDYLFVLSRKKTKDNEKAAVNFIKYGGVLLNNCAKLMNSTYHILMSSNHGLNIQRINRYIEITNNLIHDFRLMDIRSY